MRDARGITRVGAPEGRPGERRERDRVARMRPERYLDRLLREMAKQVNIVVAHSVHHFEAKKFCLDLAAILGMPPSGPPRRA